MSGEREREEEEEAIEREVETRKEVVGFDESREEKTRLIPHL